MGDNEPSTTTRRELVEARLVEEAARLFAAKGFGATSLQDVAEALQMSRPALYHYVSSKDDLLARIVEGIAEGGEHAVTAVASLEAELHPPEKLRQMTRALCLEVAGGPSQFRLLLNSDANLPDDMAARMDVSKRVVTRQLTAVVADGMNRGYFRSADAQLAALAILGMCNWVAWWYGSSSRLTVDELADGIADQAVASVLAVGQPHGGDPRVVIESLRHNLDALNRLLPD